MTRQPVLTAAEVHEFLNEVFPQMRDVYVIEELASMRARVRMPVRYEYLRPGGTVSGPTLFSAADCAFWIALLGMIGREAMSVTTTMTINFLRRPPEADIIAEARLLKLGRTLVTGDVLLYSDGMDEPVANATGSYAIPQPR
ncbi:MAG: PaaI family thioesterase [Pseudomonadota bacterium]